MRIKNTSNSFKPAQFFRLFLLVNMLLFLQATGYASFELKGSGARIQALGQAYVGLANTPDALFINCSGLAQIHQPAFAVFYSRPFGMKELALGSFAAIVPTFLGAFAAGFTSFGNELYQEQTLTFSFDRFIKQKICFGFNFHYMKLHIVGYGSDFSVAWDTGFLIKLTPNLNWGFFATNLHRATLGRSEDSLPQTFCTGFNISPISDLMLNMDIFKDSMFPLELRCGIEYQLFRHVAFRSGFTTEPVRFCAGIGFFIAQFRFDYAITTHQELGLTHSCSIQISVDQKRKKQ